MAVICFKYNNETNMYEDCDYYCDYKCVLSWFILFLIFTMFFCCCYVNICLKKTIERRKRGRRIFYIGEDPEVQELEVEGTTVNKPPDYSDI